MKIIFAKYKLSIFVLLFFINQTIYAKVDADNTKAIELLLQSVKNNDIKCFYEVFPSVDSVVEFAFKANILDSLKYLEIKRNSNLRPTSEFISKKDIVAKFVQLRYFALFDNNWNNIFINKIIKISTNQINKQNESIYFVHLFDSLNKKYHTLEIVVNNFIYNEKLSNIYIKNVYSNMSLNSTINKEAPTSLDNISTAISETPNNIKNYKIDTIYTLHSNKSFSLENVILKKYGMNWFVRDVLTKNNTEKSSFIFDAHEDIKNKLEVVNEDTSYNPIIFVRKEWDNNSSYLIYTTYADKLCGYLFDKDFNFSNAVELLLTKQ